MREHRLTYRVPYADVDRMGVVYYANYLVFFERGRTELLRACGLPYRELEERGILLPVIEAVCRYLKPARYDDELDIVTRISERRGVRIMMQCEVWRNAELLAEGHTWHAATSAEGKPCRIPDDLAALLP